MPLILSRKMFPPLAVVIDTTVGHHHHHASIRRLVPLRRRRRRRRVRIVGRRRRALHRGCRGRQMQHGRRVVNRRSLPAAAAAAAAADDNDVVRRTSIEMRVSLFEVVELAVAKRARRRCDGDGVPGVRGHVSLEALPPRVHVGAEVASVPRRVELSSVPLKLVVVPVGLSATHLKRDERQEIRQLCR